MNTIAKERAPIGDYDQFHPSTILGVDVRGTEGVDDPFADPLGRKPSPTIGMQIEGFDNVEARDFYGVVSISGLALRDEDAQFASDSGGQTIISLGNAAGFPYDLLVKIAPGTRVKVEGSITFAIRENRDRITPPEAAPMGEDVTPGEQLARKFHETYERLAPNFGYETRTETRVFDPTTPNGKLMIAVCTDLAHTARPDARDEGKIERFYEALVQADLKIRSLPGTDQSDVAFIRAALAEG